MDQRISLKPVLYEGLHSERIVCIMLTIITHLDLQLLQMNVKTRFLNRKLDEEIYKKNLPTLKSKEISAKCALIYVMILNKLSRLELEVSSNHDFC